MGDFNAFLYENEKTGYEGVDSSPCADKQECMLTAGLTDLQSTDCLLTWYNHQSEASWIKAKLDKALGNPVFFDIYERAKAYFPNVDISDHSAIVTYLKLDDHIEEGSEAASSILLE